MGDTNITMGVSMVTAPITRSGKTRRTSLRRQVREFRSNLLLYICNSLVTRIPSHAARRLFLAKLMNVHMESGSSIHMGLRLYTRGQVSIGSHTVIDRDCVLDGRGHITIGNNVNLAPEVMVLTAGHDPDDGLNFAVLTKPVVIEDYVWVATRATILPGVRIGRGAVVGAGAVVTKDSLRNNFPPQCRLRRLNAAAKTGS